MNPEGPYSPPKSSVADAPLSTPFDKKILKSLAQLVDDEPAGMARFNRTGWLLTAPGIALFVVALFAPWDGDQLWPAILSICGGFLIGMASMVFNSARQWPVFRRYLDAELIRSDYQQLRQRD